MNRFTFNTGVKIWDNPHIKGGVDSGNGTVVIPFEANAPKDAKLAFLSDNSNLDKDGEFLKCEVKNSALLSKFAYFNI
jgi:hypothetical protein